VECTNALSWFEQKREKLGPKLGPLHHSAQRTFAGVIERFETIARTYRQLMGCVIDDATFKRLVLDVVCPDPREHRNWNPEAIMASSVVERHQRKVNELRRLWKEGKGHTGEPTAWFAWNGLAEGLDHNTDLWPTRAGCFRTASMIDGTIATIKNSVLDKLVEFSNSA
jgi:Domain of unknown function (DUF932)